MPSESDTSASKTSKPVTDTHFMNTYTTPPAHPTENEVIAKTMPTSPAAPAVKPAETIRDGRKVEWRLLPDPKRPGENVSIMQEVDVETGLPWEEYQAKAKAEAEAKAKKIAEKALAEAEREKEAKEREEAAERERIRNAGKAAEKTLEAAGKSDKDSQKPKKTVEEVKKTVKKNTTDKKGGASRSDVKMESTAPEKAEEK